MGAVSWEMELSATGVEEADEPQVRGDMAKAAGA